ncbi:uncharacterized protein SAPINGB_P002374 [Magnusiomyces paraingens]|uniref:Signal peptidase complex catalytic subunit SEC11 n=1 Tax=Magnusiomyces paraingens TaxID=2606893 RepID=A0A5E8BDV3_9ASCO|nr:uncharacterized protein SAPINGB_P002374 [Saprochaete ingens]VVT49649.1 unnamed protein product [Saprochaete ingens]
MFSLPNLSPRQALAQALNLCLVVTTAFMFYKGLSVVTNSPSPIVVVLSGSMEPAFQRGDILFLWNQEHRVSTGDIVVYNIKDREIPIVHRVLRQHASPKKQLLLTKGDNNALDDLDLYAHKQMYLDREAEVVGSVKGYIPIVGYITILLTENQNFKYALLGLIGLSTLLQGEN